MIAAGGLIVKTEKLMVVGQFEGAFPQGLNRLRKKGKWEANLPKSIPQGLKPSLILLHFRHD